MNRIVALIIAGSLLFTAVAPVAAINDGTSNTRSRAAARGCDTAGHHGAPVHAEKRDGRDICVVPSGEFPAPPAR
jgi:hypothetical protein